MALRTVRALTAYCNILLVYVKFPRDLCSFPASSLCAACILCCSHLCFPAMLNSRSQQLPRCRAPPAPRSTSSSPTITLLVDMTDVRREIERLREEIRRHNRLYFVLDRPEVSDAARDSSLRRRGKQ